MAYPSDWSRMAVGGGAVLVISFAVTAAVGCVVIVFVCVKACWQSARFRLFRLGGVTTLTQMLNYPCILCRDSMLEAGEKVRTLSCDHVFHCGGSAKCENGIDHWLSTGPTTSCPICRQAPHPVLPGKRPPPSSPASSSSASVATSTSDLEAGLLLPDASSSAPAPPPAELPRTLTDSEEVLPPPARDETLPEASSSASAPPPAQLPQTSTTDSEEALPPPARDETLPEASSSQ